MTLKMLWQWHPWQLQTRICMKYSANKGCVKIWMTGFYFNLILINGFFEGKHPDESPDDPSYLLWSKIIHQLLLEIGCLPRNPDYLLFQYKHWNEHHTPSVTVMLTVATRNDSIRPDRSISPPVSIPVQFCEPRVSEVWGAGGAPAGQRRH